MANSGLSGTISKNDDQSEACYVECGRNGGIPRGETIEETTEGTIEETTEGTIEETTGETIEETTGETNGEMTTGDDRSSPGGETSSTSMAFDES